MVKMDLLKRKAKGDQPSRDIFGDCLHLTQLASMTKEHSYIQLLKCLNDKLRKCKTCLKQRTRVRKKERKKEKKKERKKERKRERKKEGNKEKRKKREVKGRKVRNY